MSFTKEKEISGHSGAIYSCSYDGVFLYTGSADKFVARWKPQEGIQDNFAIRFENSIYSLVSQGALLFVGRSDGGIHIFDTVSREELKYFTQHTVAIFSLSVNAEKNHFYAGDADGNVSVWNLETFELLLYLPLDCGKIRDIAVKNDGERIALSCQDGTLRIFDTTNFNELYTIQAHKDGTTASCFIPNSDLIVSGGKDAMLRLWDIPVENQLKEVPAHNFAIYRLRIAGDEMISVSRDKTIKVWSHDLDFKTRLDLKAGGHKHSVNDCVVLSNSRFATCGDDGKLMIWSK